ncbi:MAG: type II toxin-antitoxin system RelE family toxin [Desulfobacterales bacterium]
METRLITAPQEYGEPLRKTPKNYWKFIVGDYRVVFRVNDNDIIVLGICHKKEIYSRIRFNSFSLQMTRS